MSNIRLVITLLLAVTLLPADAGGPTLLQRLRAVRYSQRSIRHCRHHVDVTNRLKELARQDRTFRMGTARSAFDPDRDRTRPPHLCPRAECAGTACFEFS